MSAYNHAQSKSVMKPNESYNAKLNGINSLSSNPFNKTTLVNLSKLGTYKGKFSLTTKYNSLSLNCNKTQNHPSQYQSQNHNQKLFEDEYNKENESGMANKIIVQINEKNGNKFAVQTN